MKWITQTNFNYLKGFTIGTLLVGSYCHLSRVVFGMNDLLHFLLTPLFEAFFSIPMLIAVVLQCIYIKKIEFRKLSERLVYYFTTFQFVVSTPLHIYAAIAKDSSYARFFPPIYSILTIIMWGYFMYVFLFLKIKSANYD